MLSMTLAIKEWQMTLRSRLLPAIFLALLLLLAIGFATTDMQHMQLYQARTAAGQHFRQQWDQLKAGDPHSAAHFGTYLFKPVSTLSNFDNGLDHFTGYTMRVEAHIQHSLATPALTPADTYLRFGQLTMASVLQLFFPLLILFYCFNSYTQERVSGTLQLLQLQGAPVKGLLHAKTGFYLVTVNGMLLLSMLIFLPALLLSGGQPVSGADLLRLLLLMLCYGGYCSIFVMLAIMVSAFAKNARQSLLVLAGIWLLWNILLPRLTAAAGATLYPLPSQHALQEKIEKGIKMGLHGDDPREARQQRLTQALLQRYHVRSPDQLPVNLDAILMQATEDYTQLVYNAYAAQTDSIIRRQNNLTRYAALLDPYLAIRSISMALCGTDYDHQWHFDMAARVYRNAFISRLNNELAYHHSGTGTATAGFFQSMPVFRYQPPDTCSVLWDQWLALLSLLLWLPVSVLLLKSSITYASKI